MRSMTGFGRAVVERRGTRVLAEVRALNQRFFELKLSLPRGWGEHEARIRKMVQGVVARGRVEVFLRCVTVKPLGTQLVVDERLARLYVGELRRLGRRLRLDGRLGLDAVAHRPEIFRVMENEGDRAYGVRLGLEALGTALRRLEAERLREGRSLRRDFAVRLRKIAAATPKIRHLAERSRRDIIETVQTRIKDLLGNQPVNEKRLYEEAAAAAQRGDITEELTRLKIHLDALGGLINRDAPVGKSIEFLLQEINREVNTMGSKAQSAALSQLTVAIKGEAEKMREQAQNVE